MSENSAIVVAYAVEEWTPPCLYQDPPCEVAHRSIALAKSSSQILFPHSKILFSSADGYSVSNKGWFDSSVIESIWQRDNVAHGRAVNERTYR